MRFLALLLSSVLPAAHAPGPAPDVHAGPTGRQALVAWTYRPDPADAGLRAGWATGRFAGRPVTVPHAANPVGQDATRAQLTAAYRGSVGWYRRTLTVRGGTYVLCFDSIAFHADVFVDGRLVARHDGAYAPFEARLRLPGGRHAVVVRDDWRSPQRQSALGFHRTWFNDGGMDREATLRRVGASEVLDAALTTRLTSDGARVDVQARVRNDRPTTRTVLPLARLGRRTVALAPVTLGPDQEGTTHGTLHVDRDALWSPDHPRLQRLTVGVAFESTFVADVGLRQLTWPGGRLEVNGRPVVLRGASLQEDAPDRGDALRPADQDRLVAELRAVGANATRAQHPLAPGLLERLDRAGIMVWQELGPIDSPGRFLAQTPAQLALARARVRADLRANRLHPSIVGWSLGTEVAGDGVGAQAAFVDAAARELHAADPGRPVGVDLWDDHFPASPGLLYRSLDAVGLTSYEGWYDDTFAPPAEVAADLRARLQRLRALFPDKVRLLSEFGAEGSPDDPAADRGGEGYQASLIALHLRTLRDPGSARPLTGLSGALVWVLRDFTINPAFRGGTISRVAPRVALVPGRNRKGLFDAAGRPKPAAAAARRGFAALAR